MSLTPKQVFKKFNTKDVLIAIAEKKGIHLSKKQKKNVGDFLAEETVKQGLKGVLSVLKTDNLIALSKHKAINYDAEKKEKFGDEETMKSKKWHPVKPVMIKTLSESIPDYGVSEFFGDQKRSTLLGCCKVIDDLEDYDENELQEFTKGDLSDAIMHNIYNFGLQNLFSSFTITELKEFCEDCDLTVRSSSKETLLDCLIEQKDFRRNKVSRKKTEIPSDKKPRIRQGVRKIDLTSWFLRTELEEYCRDNGIRINGNKKDLIERIYLYLSGERTNKVMAPGRKKQSTKIESSGSKVKNAVSGVAKRAAKKSKERKKSAEPTRRSRRLEEKSRSRDESSSSSS